MDIFKAQELLEFSERFKTDDDFRSYLAEIVFSDGFKCKKCEYIIRIKKIFNRDE
jgi:hypothetical protein